MHIRFDAGTLLFGDVPEGFDLGLVDGIRFDQRVKAWRARACDKDAILHALQLKGMEVGLMQAFPGLTKLKVLVVGPKGQSASVLLPGKRTVIW